MLSNAEICKNAPSRSANTQEDCGGWELEAARWVVHRVHAELMSLHTVEAEQSMLNAAEGRYRVALRLLERIQSALKGVDPSPARSAEQCSPCC
ncbi:MAG TPA: hypothetical protein VHK24_15455 [Steroidobacter sp.]|nr:hypothetical protein [Steroidobacter sp.]